MIAVRGLAHRYGAAEALRLPEWKVAQGERWLVLGPSGCGKTTLLHILAGLVRPSEGQVEVSGESLLKLEGATHQWGGLLHLDDMLSSVTKPVVEPSPDH